MSKQVKLSFGSFGDIGFDGPMLAIFKEVCLQVTSVVAQLFEHNLPHDFIHIHIRPTAAGNPQIISGVVQGTDEKVYVVEMAIEAGLYYCQWVYQLSHELAHLFFGYSRSNSVIEALAMALSFCALREMTDKWLQESDPLRKDYASKFKTYAEQQIGKHLSELRPEMPQAVARSDWSAVRRYLRTRSFVTADVLDRPLQVLAAQLILARGVSWSSLVGLAHLTEPIYDSENPSCDDRHSHHFRRGLLSKQQRDVIGLFYKAPVAKVFRRKRGRRQSELWSRRSANPLGKRIGQNQRRR